MYGENTDKKRAVYEEEWQKLIKAIRKNQNMEASQLEQLKSLSQRGHCKSSFNVAEYYVRQANGTKSAREKNRLLKEAEKYLMRYAKQGDDDDRLQAGTCFAFGNYGFRENPDLAVECFRMGAEDGNPFAMMNLGRCYYWGKGVPFDFEQARQWFEKAAMGGSVRGWIFLGLLYMDGKGVQRDLSAAAECFENGLRQAGDELTALTEGRSIYSPTELKEVIEDCEKYLKAIRIAIKWEELQNGKIMTKEEEAEFREELLQQSQVGNHRAQIHLAIAYEEGKYGFSQDYREAFYWFKKCEESITGARVGLGRLYYYGRGVEQDYAMAVQHFRKAAELTKNLNALEWLGDCYERGHGVVQDREQAAKWYQMAAEEGSKYAKKKLEQY